MTDASEILWISGHGGEYGRYYPSAVEAEGEHGGKAVGYVGADLHKAQAKRIAELEDEKRWAYIEGALDEHDISSKRIAELEAALRAIYRQMDYPQHFNGEINKLCKDAINNEAALKQECYETIRKHHDTQTNN